MPSGVTTSFIVTETLFLGTGVMITIATVLWMNEMNSAPTIDSVTRHILISHFPMQGNKLTNNPSECESEKLRLVANTFLFAPALLANAIVIFFTVLLSIPALIIPTSRGWLKVHGWFVVICAIFTLILGLNEWLQTLTTRADLLHVWGKQPDNFQSLVQQKVSSAGFLIK